MGGSGRGGGGAGGGQEGAALNAPDDVLRMWTVYDHPADYPDGFIARLWEVEGSSYRATDQVVTGGTLDGVRAQLPPGLHRLPRSVGDDPVVVETWL